jgi:hypothetical protein
MWSAQKRHCHKSSSTSIPAHVWLTHMRARIGQLCSVIARMWHVAAGCFADVQQYVLIQQFPVWLFHALNRTKPCGGAAMRQALPAGWAWHSWVSCPVPCGAVGQNLCNCREQLPAFPGRPNYGSSQQTYTFCSRASIQPWCVHVNVYTLTGGMIHTIK